MSRKLPEKQIRKICLTALREGITDKTAAELGITKGRLSQIFSKQKFTVLMPHEIYDNCGKERNFKDLQKVFKLSLEGI